MSIKLNRRQILLSLVGVGAAIAVTHETSATEINAVWKKLQLDPWYFEVHDCGMIVEAGRQEPKINRDVYRIEERHLETPYDLVRAVEGNEEICSRLRWLAEDEREEAAQRLTQGDVGWSEKRRLQALIKDLENDDGWKYWVRLPDGEGFAAMRQLVSEFLNEPVDWMNSERWPTGWCAQGTAYLFFWRLDHAVRDKLGVAIVEGDHPGSSYKAAELRNSIASANETAEQLRLPFRFREQVES